MWNHYVNQWSVLDGFEIKAIKTGENYYTVHPPIFHTPIFQQNPICKQFFENKNVTNWVRGGFLIKSLATADTRLNLTEKSRANRV